MSSDLRKFPDERKTSLYHELIRGQCLSLYQQQQPQPNQNHNNNGNNNATRHLSPTSPRWSKSKLAESPWQHATSVENRVVLQALRVKNPRNLWLETAWAKTSHWKLVNKLYTNRFSRDSRDHTFRISITDCQKNKGEEQQLNFGEFFLKLQFPFS